MSKIFVALLSLACARLLPALTVDSTVSDHCVLLQNAQNVVKGTARAGKTVTVGFAGGPVLGSAKADGSGAFKVTFNPGGANATARELVVSDGASTQTIADVLVGEVWLVAGQSNAFNMMDGAVMSGDYAKAYPDWKAQFDCPSLRVVISTPRQSAGGEGDYYKAAPDQPLNWIVCRKSNENEVKRISPLAFFFGRELAACKRCPVGILLVGKGGTPIGYHMTEEAYAAAKAAFGGDIPWGDGRRNNGNLSACYTRFDSVAARGAIWAQGESDASVGGNKYRHSLKALIDDWRSPRHRNRPDFPVLIYSFANFDNAAFEDDWRYPRVRWEQEKAVAELIPHAAVFHAIDLSGSSQKGFAKAIHPDQKPELAARALLAARNLVYGENVAYRCPNPTEAVFNADRTKVYVRFPPSVKLQMNGTYRHFPFRVKNASTERNGKAVNPTGVRILPDGRTLEIAFSGLALNAKDKGNSVSYCNVGGTPDRTFAYELRIVDQNGFPMPPFDLDIANGP